MSREGRRRDTEPLLGDTTETRSRRTVCTKHQRIARTWVSSEMISIIL